MIHVKQRLLSPVLLTIAMCIGFQSSLISEENEKKAANELLDLIRFEKEMDDIIQATMQMVKRNYPEMSEEQEKTLKEFYKKHMSAGSLRNEVSAIYADIFTESELHDIASFYKTKTGQKALQKFPEIMQRAMDLAQTRVLQNMDDMQEILTQGRETKEDSGE